MTLLEVILSIAILGGTVTVIGEISRSAFQDARMARDIVQAELLAESILAKVRLGIIEMEPVFDNPVGLSTTNNQADFVEDTHAVSTNISSEPLWFYSLEVVDVEDFLVEIAVTVRQNLPEARRPVVCRLVRWVALEPEPEEEEEEI